MSSLKPKSNRALFSLIAMGLLTVTIAFWFKQNQRQPGAPIANYSQGISAPKTLVAPITPGAPLTLTVKDDHTLQAACDMLSKESDARTIREKLAALRQALSGMPTNTAVALIRQFLAAKADASTHLGFKLASDGFLDDAPTLRTFLLDELGRMDPAAAADYAKIILSSMDSPDEWAVALRNLAAGDPSDQGRALLEEKTADMLQFDPWQQNPSTGFLESFDVAVYLGGADFVPTLSDMVRSQDDPAISHAAFLALDRLVINDPGTVLQALQDDPDMMEGRESTRADYFARANVADPQQLQILENYLLNPDLSPAELQTFAGIFPNVNYMISANLLTQNATPDRQALNALDAQSLAVVQQWMADPRFSQIAPQLQTITQRLEGFAAQAGTGH